MKKEPNELMELIMKFAEDGCPYSKKWLADIDNCALKAELTEALDDLMRNDKEARNNADCIKASQLLHAGCQ